MKKTHKQYHETIRKPCAPPTKVFGSTRDYKREQNYLEIDLYLSDRESEEEVTIGVQANQEGSTEETG